MARVEPALLDLLPRVPLFGGLEGVPLERVIQLLGEEDRAEAEVVGCQGQNCRALYVVREGEVLESKELSPGRKAKLVRLGPGEVFGERSLVEMQALSATYTCAQPTRLLVLHQRELAKLYREDLPTYTLLLGNLARELSRRLRRAEERLIQLADAAGEGERSRTQLAVPALKLPTK
ncbi:MAG: cyclic nucleotide-binding domain-containing protein [Deltaproteobacteria bacterium]|nr:cyclic nucleotide-binding domain-containing protein [Deltaproteobacteria bacterium]